MTSETDVTWDQLSDIYEKEIFDSLTSKRIPFLRKVQHLLDTNKITDDKQELLELCQTLLKTYNYYQDVNSRNELLKTLEKIVLFKNEFLPVFIKFTYDIAVKERSMAVTDYLTLLSWINKFSIITSDLGVSNQELIDKVVLSQAYLFNNCVNTILNESNQSFQHRRRINDSVLLSTKYSITHTFVKLDGSTKVIDNYINALTSPSNKVPPTVVISYLGVISDAIVDALPTYPGLLNHLNESGGNVKSSILNYYTNQVLLNKIPPHDYSLKLFGKYIESSINENDFNTVIVPVLDKAILRSSEVSFGYLIPRLIEFLSKDIDLSNTLVNTKLLNNFLNAFKSPKELTRNGAFTSMELLIHNHFEGASDDILAKLIDECLKSFKGTSNNESKYLIVKTLSMLKFKNTGISLRILNGLLPLVSKDQNEISLNGLINAFINQYLDLIVNNEEISDEDNSKFVDQFKLGLSDKKMPLRRIWFLELGAYVYNTMRIVHNVKFLQLIETLYPIFISSIEEAQQSPLPTITTKGISCSYVLITLSSLVKKSLKLIDDKKVFINSLRNTEKPSILTSSKVFTKLTNLTEIIWFLRALREASGYINLLDQNDKNAYGHAWIYMAISENIPYDLRLQCLKFMGDCLNENAEEFSKLIIDSIYCVLIEADNQKDQEVYSYNFKFLSPVLSVITQSKNHHTSKISLQKLLVAANHDLIPIRNEWVGLCQRSNVNIGDLVGNNSDEIFASTLEFLKNNAFAGLIYKAAIKSMSMISFIKPEVFGPKLSALMSSDLDIDKIVNIDNQSIQIWQGTDGVLVLDVLNNSSDSKRNDDKNNRDYETRKWEEEMRKELANKNKGKITKKLTKEEHVLVNEQLNKESNTRKEVQILVNDFHRGIDIINDLVSNATQVDNGSAHWYPVAISKILILTESKVIPQLLHDLPLKSFLHLAELISSRLGSLKGFVGVAILRLNGVVGLKENLLEEPILSLTSRILFRIKFLSDQNPLDSLSLSYILPLLTKVLENGKMVAMKNATKQKVTSEFVEEDPEEEQLLLAIEIISSHAEVFEDDTIPRQKILEVILSLMRLPSKAKLSKECFLAMCQHISVSITKNDLKILFDNVISPEVFVRNAVLEGIDSEFDLTTEMNYSNELWIAIHDNDPNSAELARTIWEDNKFELSQEAPTQLLQYAGNKDSGLRLSIANAIYSSVLALLDSNKNIFEETLNELIDLYHVKKNPPPPALDRFGLVIKSSSDQRDTWEERSTIALTIKLLSPFFEKQTIEKLFRFLVDEKALGDKEDLVRQELQEAGVEVIKKHGFTNIETLIPIFEACLAAKDDGSKTQDNIRECVIILYGALARHLDESDSRLDLIVDRLIKTLDTPSEDVQYAISECIAPLVVSFTPKLQHYFDILFEKLFEGKNMASRRGGAYGISGLVKGSGIKSLSTYDIIRNLTDAADDKKNSQRREGVSFAFECLSQSLGKFFEPYVIEILPILLKSLGDQVPEVREATDSAAKQIMKNTTSFGVKKLIPVAISNLDEIAWRSKKGSVELLGSMAYLDPTQLSSSLSTIVPEIVGVLNDTHKEVRKAADQALKRFGEVIRNPEIQAIVPDLINAIGDPTKYTESALDKLIQTQFVHYIDGPSLALIIHVIHRGMKDRSAATKKKACQIVGNMAILVDSKDLRPYLSALVGELEVAMVDPVPGTRSTAARALGSLVEKLGEEQFPDLIPRLLDTLRDETRAGDRLGSAQALSEVISGLGINKLEELLPDILSSASSPRNYIRAGFMPLLLFLPVCFGSQFSPYLNRIIPPILSGLADTDEEIRDTALRAGRLIVKNYAKKAVDLLLPELEIGLSDTNYRIRLSSVELTGDLLFQVTGISGKSELTEEVSEFSGEVNKTLIEVLGQDRRDRILSLLFVCRSDVAGIVRSAAVDIWKALVANTPRTVKEILPSLTQIIVRRLASSDEEQRTIAAQTLGEMIRRVGANALAQLLPTLQSSLVSGDNDAKQGICIALSELIKSTLYDGLVEYQGVFISIIRDALIDPATKVREAAAEAFKALQEQLGKVVIDAILPYLLNMLESDNTENALLALKDIMATRADVIFPILIPTLLSPPIDAFKARALSSLASVAGHALYKRLSLIINTLVSAVIDSKNESEASQDEIKSAFDKILLAIDDDEGVHPLMQQLLSLVKHEDAAKRAVIYERLGSFFAHTNLDYTVYIQDMVSQFILSLGDRSPEVVKGSFDALSALVKRQSKESLERLIKPARQALSITGVRGEELAAFTLPRGPNCILPIFSHGLMYGNSDQREMSAHGIADIIDKTPAANLKPFATTITGPLIRVIGERVSSDIKAGILYALTSLLSKIPQFLRPFIPQLQRTFVRSLSDPQNDALRSRAVIALGTLIEHQPRVDSLVTELVTGARNASEQGVKTAMLKGMLEVVSKAGENMNEASKTSILSLVEDEITLVSDKSAVSYARLIGSLSQILSTEEATSILKSKILEKQNDVSVDNHKFAILSINSFLKDAPHHIFQTGLLDEIVTFIINCANSSNDYISANATVAIGKLCLLLSETKSPVTSSTIVNDKQFEIDDDNIHKLVEQLATNMVKPNSNSPDTRRLSLVIVRTIARFKYQELVKPFYDLLVPSVFTCVRDTIIPIKLAAEKAYIAIFNLVDDEQMNDFNQWFNSKQSNISGVVGISIIPRSIGDYTKRVATRLAGVERERIEAGGDEETLFSDRIEDESEVWAIGGVDLSK